MSEQFPQFRQKSKEELENQLNKVESSFGQKIEPENTRTKLLSMDLNELKNNFPEDYQEYYSFLKIESALLNFPDMDMHNDAEKPKINFLPAGARGSVYKINFENASHIIKPLESTAEKNISEKASELGIGPKQYKTKEGFLHEEFIDGKPLLKLDREKCTPEYMKNLGGKFAQALKILHENNILINDQILTDDFGKSHTIIDKEGKVRFIDFGASVNIEQFPNITDEEVLSLMRTDPFMAFRIGNMKSLSKEELKTEIDGYRENILAQYKTKEDIINAKDMQLVNEGIYFLQNRLPNVSSFIEGIKLQMRSS